MKKTLLNLFLLLNLGIICYFWWANSGTMLFDNQSEAFISVARIAGLFPDIDILITWIYNFFTSSQVNFHGTFTHSLLWPLLFLIIGLFSHYQKNLKWAKIFYVISASWIFHLILDCAFGGYKEYLWPFFISAY